MNKTTQQIAIDAAAERRAQEQAARQQQEFVASLYAKGLRIGANGQPEPIPGWVDPTKGPDEAGTPDLAAVRAEAIDKIRLARTLQQRSRDGWFTTGAGANVARLIGGSPAYDVRQDTETLKNAGALTRIMEMAKANGGKNPLTPLSNSDFQALASSLSNLETGQSDTQFQTNVQRVIDMYTRAYQGAGGTDLERELGGAAPVALPSPIAKEERAFTVNNLADFAGGLTGGKYAFDANGGLTYNGKPVDVSADVANSEQYRDAYFRKFGEYPGVTVDVVGGQVTPEAQSELERNRDTVFGAVDAGVRGFADTATFGIVDPLSAAVRSAFNGDSFGENLARERAISATDEDVNSYSRLAGQVAGVVPAFTNLTKFGATALPSRPHLGAAIADTAGGAVYGGASHIEKDPVVNALIGGTAGLVGNQVGQRVFGPVAEALIAKTTGQSNPVARALMMRSQGVDLDQVGAKLDEAASLRIPMALADTDPKLRLLAGSTTRLAPQGREFAERAIEPRGRGQAERAISAIERDFGAPVDVRQAGQDLVSRGRAQSAPLYESAYAAPVITTPELKAILATPAGRQALARARTIAANERRDPQAMGFAMDRDGNVVLSPVQIDLYGEQAAARAAFDDAQAAHREAMRTTGANTENTRSAMTAARDRMQRADEALRLAPSEGTAATMSGYTTQTLDYVKRGLDDILEERRDPVTRRLILDEAGRAINDVRSSLIREVDRLNSGYASARQAYQRPARERDALDAGYGAVSPRTNPDTMGHMTSGLSPAEMGQFRTGYASGLTDQVERMRYTANPFDAIYGTPDQVAKAGALFPEGAPNFARQVELERDLARTQQEVLGGSPTAGRRAADEQFGPGFGIQMGGETLLGLATGTPPIGAITNAARGTMSDRLRMGMAGRDRAAEIAALLLDPAPERASQSVQAIIAQELLRTQGRAVGRGVGTAVVLPALGTE